LPNDCVAFHFKYLRALGQYHYCDLVMVMFDVMCLYSSASNYVDRIGVASRSSPDLTGFFIAKWLIDERGLDPSAALASVCASLPPGITKSKYIDELGRLYGVALSPVPLERPPSPPPEAEEAWDVPAEIKVVCRCPCQRIPLTDYAPFASAAAGRVADGLFCLALEAAGDRAIGVVTKSEYKLYFERRRMRTDVVSSSFAGSAVVEGVLCPNQVFVISDIVALNGEVVGGRPFGERMAMIERELFQSWLPGKSDSLRLEMRPFYPMNRYKKVMCLFTRKCIRFTRFQPRGVAMWPIEGDDRSAFIWEEVDSGHPKVIAHINLANLMLYGHAMTKSTNVAVAHLGPVTPENARLNGVVVEIQVREKDPAVADLLNATVKRPAFGEKPWSVTDFLKWYPDQGPHLPPEALEGELARLALLPQYL
jgi:hypothetical protein